MQLWLPFLARSGTAPKTNTRLVVSCADRACEVAVRRDRRARRYVLRVSERNREVILTMPVRGSLREAQRFAERNAGWIAASLARIPRPVPFADGETIPLRGVPHRIAHRPRARGVVWTEAMADGTPLLCVAGDGAHLARRLTDYLRREARSDLLAASRRYAARLGVKVERVGVRDTASRWGSCSRDRTLSYSWRLVLAPPFVLDYLAAHEVAHCRELNHSRRFWKLVDELMPERRRAEAWLKTHGNSLHRFGGTAN